MARPPQQLAGRIWVSGVTLLIAFIAYSSQIFIIWPWYGHEVTVELLVLLVPFNTLVAFLYWNYFLCVYSDPGTPPDNWEPSISSEEGFELKQLTGQPRYCRHCKRFKPPRAHHCKKCKRCILRMDHHCPWTDNCIGLMNYTHFLRFLWAVDIACSYHICMVTRRVYYAIIFAYYEPSGFELAFIVANYAACLPVIVAVGGFSLYHFYCLFTNTTTVEGWEKDSVTRLVRRGRISEFKFPYNLGPWRNFTSVFGGNPLFWCWPLYHVKSDGLYFPVADGTEPLEQYVWPPKDPYREQHEDRIPSGDPWTYGNGGINPTLKASNTHLRRSAVPPYHPSYKGDDVEDNISSSSSPERQSHSSNEYLPYSEAEGAGARHRDGWRISSDDDTEVRHGVKLRDGSEGREVTLPNRWAQLEELEEGEYGPGDVDGAEETQRGRSKHRVLS